MEEGHTERTSFSGARVWSWPPEEIGPGVLHVVVRFEETRHLFSTLHASVLSFSLSLSLSFFLSPPPPPPHGLLCTLSHSHLCVNVWLLCNRYALLVEEGWSLCIDFSAVGLRVGGTVGLFVGVLVSLNGNVWDWDLVDFKVVISMFLGSFFLSFTFLLSNINMPLLVAG